MKKMLAKFSESLLSKDQMRKVKGGYMVHCICNNGMTFTTDESATDYETTSYCGNGGLTGCVVAVQ